jgi:hypothetical protein
MLGSGRLCTPVENTRRQWIKLGAFVNGLDSVLPEQLVAPGAKYGIPRRTICV